jgi:hypothetical protein
MSIDRIIPTSNVQTAVEHYGLKFDPEDKKAQEIMKRIRVQQYKLMSMGINNLSLTISLDYLTRLRMGNTFMQLPGHPDKIFGMEVIPTEFKDIIIVGVRG